MKHNIDTIIKTVRAAGKELKAREFNLDFFIYLNSKTVKLSISMDVCGTYIYLEGKRVSKKSIKDLFANDSSSI